jgi:hypothetical protein
MQRRLSDEPPKKTSISIISDVRDLCSFSAPPLTAPCKHARASSVLPDDTAARERLRFAHACMICDSPALFRSCSARPCSRDAGASEKAKDCCLSCAGRLRAKDAFQHAVFTGSKKKRQKRRGRRGSAARIQETVKNPNLRNRRANAVKR